MPAVLCTVAASRKSDSAVRMVEMKAAKPPASLAATQNLNTKAQQLAEARRMQSKVVPITVSVVALCIAVFAPILVPQMRERVVALTHCKLGAICAPGQPRPLLDRGSESRAIWDTARFYMRTRFERGLRYAKPGATVSFLSEEPVVVYFDGVLDDEEIDLMIDAATPYFVPSRVVSSDGSLVEDSTRTSSTAWLYVTDNPRFATIIEKCTSLIGFSAEQSEDISVNKYEKPPGANVGGQYRAHRDFFMDEPSLRHFKFNHCQRAATMLIYLTDTVRGGETLFLRDGVSSEYNSENPSHILVIPKRGRVLAWFDCNPYTEEPDMSTLHAGLPIEEGVKLAATLFIRNCTGST